jgi:hypothetical protein
MVTCEGVETMEALVEYISMLEGRRYRCLYTREYSRQQGYFVLKMVPGSLRWIENGNQTDKAI